MRVYENVAVCIVSGFFVEAPFSNLWIPLCQESPVLAPMYRMSTLLSIVIRSEGHPWLIRCDFP